MPFTWTNRLAIAARELAVANATPRQYREYNDQDIRSRAAEFARLRVGQVFEPHQVQYLHCLIQRLEPSYDPSGTHGAFLAAYDEANADFTA